MQVSHLLNKPIESICGYLTVLPGAFSAFRWAAVEVSFAGVMRSSSSPPPVPVPCLPEDTSPALPTTPLPGRQTLPAGRAAAPLLLRPLLPERPERV